MFKQGLVTEVFPNKGTCRVKFIDTDIVSKELQVCFPGTMANKFYTPFRVNELVACLMDEFLEEGVVIGSLYNDEDTPTGTSANSVRTVYADGTIVDYNFSTHTFTIDGGNVDITINCNKATIDAAEGVEINGALSVNGELTVDGDIGSTGTVTAEGDVISGLGEVSLNFHVHLGVTPGSGISGVPQQ